jgi:hypothetical protein
MAVLQYAKARLGMTEGAWVLNKEPTFLFAGTVKKCDYPFAFA